MSFTTQRSTTVTQQPEDARTARQMAGMELWDRMREIPSARTVQDVINQISEQDNAYKQARDNAASQFISAIANPASKTASYLLKSMAEPIKLLGATMSHHDTLGKELLGGTADLAASGITNKITQTNTSGGWGPNAIGNVMGGAIAGFDASQQAKAAAQARARQSALALTETPPVSPPALGSTVDEKLYNQGFRFR